MTQPAPAATYKPRSSKIWWAITAATIFAAFAIPAVLAATEANSQTPTPPDCIAEDNCWKTRADVPDDAQRDCLRSDIRNGQTVFVRGEGRQPNGDYRYCAGINFCRKPVPNGYRYTAANCRNQ